MGIYGKLSGDDVPLPKIYPTDVLSEKQLNSSQVIYLNHMLPLGVQRFRSKQAKWILE
jgi:hypothetical protein